MPAAAPPRVEFAIYLDGCPYIRCKLRVKILRQTLQGKLDKHGVVRSIVSRILHLQDFQTTYA